MEKVKPQSSKIIIPTSQKPNSLIVGSYGVKYLAAKIKTTIATIIKIFIRFCIKT